MSYTKVQEPMDELLNGDGEGLTDINHLIGFTLGEARNIALEKGYLVESVSITAPPKLQISDYENDFRVLRVHSVGDNRLTILVCKPL